MLKQRVITAIILLLALTIVATQLPSFYFAIVISLLILIASWEWTGFIGLSRQSTKITYLLTVAFMLLGLFFLLGVTPNAVEIDEIRVAVILALGLLFWLLSVFVLTGYPQNSRQWNDESKIASMGLFALAPAWTGIVTLKYLLPSGYLVLALVVLIAAVDVGAYFAGKSFGSRKLAPNLSPKKTWEGVWGGMVACLLVSAGLAWCMHNYMIKLSIMQMAFLICLSAVLTFFSVVGDLVESMLKRNQNLKDSGALLPGHGGILDRVDGLIAAIPVFVLTMMLIISDIG